MSMDRWWLFYLLALPASAATLALAILWETPSERAACDRAFTALIAAPTIVELERAKFLLRRGNCAIAKRFRERPS
jgi:hypothetical protein